MPIDAGKTVECNLQKPGGYELAVDVVTKPGEEFQSDRGYRDSTRFPARIRTATALRDSGNFGVYSISHREKVLTIKQLRDNFAPTADDVQLERATKQLLAHGTLREPVGIERPTKVEITQATFVRDPYVRAWVLAAAKGFCEACANQAPFSTDDGWPFLEVHHVKMLSDGGSDKITNAVALCPNCHRRFHHSADREFFVTSNISTSSAPDPRMITRV
jgi:5-methylcytosine-specific restriction protein A